MTFVFICSGLPTILMHVSIKVLLKLVSDCERHFRQFFLCAAALFSIESTKVSGTNLKRNSNQIAVQKLQREREWKVERVESRESGQKMRPKHGNYLQLQ